MRIRPETNWLIVAAFVSTTFFAVSQSRAAPPAAAPPKTARIEMEIALESGLQPTASHDWQKILTDLKVDGVRLRSSKPGDKPEIMSTGTAAAPTYKVMGRLSGANGLVLPGGRFQTSDRAALSTWLAKLRQDGPGSAAGGPKLPFGLSKDQFGQVGKDLSQTISFSTLGQTPTNYVNKLADSLAYPLAADRTTAAILAGAPPIDVELRGLSAGTATAYVLDGAGLALAPRADGGKPLGYEVISADVKSQRWPIGLPPKKPKPELAPEMFETIEVELDDVELNRVLESIGEATKLPILTDRRSLAKAKIDLAKTRVSLPNKKLVYASVLDRTLGPKFLEHEIRVDDAGKPFLFIRAVRAGPPIEKRPAKSVKEKPR